VKVTLLVTPTPAPTVIQMQDPILGVWRNFSFTGIDNRIRFNAEGTFIESFYLIDEESTVVFNGTWSAQGSNSYALALNGTNNEVFTTFIYDPARNVIYQSKNPSQTLTPYHGDVMAASKPVPLPNFSSQT